MAFSRLNNKTTSKAQVEKVQQATARPTNEQSFLTGIKKQDPQTVKQGKIIEENLNQGNTVFIPDLFFLNLMNSVSLAKQLYGERLITLITGHTPSYIEKNKNIPEFSKELKQAIKECAQELNEGQFVKEDGTITQKGIGLAANLLYYQELEKLTAKGYTGKKKKKKSNSGEVIEFRQYKTGDGYQDIAFKKTVRTAVKRQHKTIAKQDLQSETRSQKGKITVVYALDASASMKGSKLEASKKAGIALAYGAITEKDEVGLVVFGSTVKDTVEATQDFQQLLLQITKVTASKQTNFPAMITKAIELFTNANTTKHLVVITDALPTYGSKPEQETLEAVSLARAHGITVSLVGISLTQQGKKLAEQIVRIGEGRLYTVQETEDLDLLILEDYYTFKENI